MVRQATLLFLALVLLASCDAIFGSKAAQAPVAAPPVASFGGVWKYIDGGAAHGLDPSSHGVLSPSVAYAGGKLYAAWAEYVPSTNYAVHVSVFNGDTANPSWTAVDGGTAQGLNYGTHYARWPRLSVFNDELYLSWSEDSATTTKIHVSKYVSGSTWTSLDTPASGLNYGTAENAEYGASLAQVGSALYAVWVQVKAGVNHLYASVFDGTPGSAHWTPIIAESAFLGVSTTDGPSAVGFQGQLVVAWVEGGSPTGLRVSTYDGSTWSTSAAGSIQVDATKSVYSPVMAVADGVLYLAWGELSATAERVHVKAFQGGFDHPSWVGVDGNPAGLNHDPAQYAYRPTLAQVNGGLVATYLEENGVNTQLRAKAFNGSLTSPSWKAVDGNTSNGLNYDPAYPVIEPSAVGASGKLYMVTTEYSGYSANSVHVLQGE